MPHLARKVLFAGPLVRLVDVRCREVSSTCSGEERADTHQLIVVRAGVFVKHPAFASRQSLVAEPMHALLLNRHNPFRISHPARGGDDCTVLEISPDAVTEVAAWLEERIRDRPQTPFLISHALFTAPMRIELHRIRSAAWRAADPMAGEERLLELLGQVLAGGYRAHGRRKAPRREETRRAQRDLVERTRLILSSSAAKSWSLSELAREVASSPFHLTRVFHATTGMPIHRYLRDLRLALALEQLGSARGRLSEVAVRSGFATHSHFSTAFRRAFGVTPSLSQSPSGMSAGP
ncbi:MAG TPA: AraC family transcriptional regulator [Gemmatimonadales bacterium]|nr:AraC family transcriptional regulator [Gemmatimonadales bacterium]